MKFLVSAIVLLAIAYANAKPPKEQMDKINAAMAICKPRTGATDDDIAVLMKHEVPITKGGQCFVACMNKEFGIMAPENKKINVDHIKELAAPLKEKDAEKYEKGMKVVETCAVEANAETDECEVARKMMECCKKEAAAIGIISGETS